jgi:hypothetical protein
LKLCHSLTSSTRLSTNLLLCPSDTPPLSLPTDYSIKDAIILFQGSLGNY